MGKEMPVIMVNRVGDTKRIIRKKWRAKEDESRVARFFLVQHTKTGKIYQNDLKIYQNCLKIYQMALKFTNIFHCKIIRNLPKLYFWFENIPSGNHG
jgi:hypothetical protein